MAKGKKATRKRASSRRHRGSAKLPKRQGAVKPIAAVTMHERLALRLARGRQRHIAHLTDKEVEGLREAEAAVRGAEAVLQRQLAEYASDVEFKTGNWPPRLTTAAEQQRFLEKLANTGRRVHTRTNVGGREPAPIRKKIRAAIERLHAKHPERNWFPVTHQVAVHFGLNVRYVRRAGEAPPSLRW